MEATKNNAAKMTDLEKVQRDADFQAKYYSVMVDGNRHQNMKRIVMERPANRVITAARCREIAEKIQTAYPTIKIERLEINMDEYDYSEITTEGDAGLYVYGDYPLRRTLNKKAFFIVKSNTLQIWENGLPIYENANGNICKDRDALADCLC